MKEWGRSHMVWSLFQRHLPCPHSGLLAGCFLDYEPTCHPCPLVHFPCKCSYLRSSGCIFCWSEENDSMVKLGVDNIFCWKWLLSNGCFLNVIPFTKRIGQETFKNEQFPISVCWFELEEGRFRLSSGLGVYFQNTKKCS